MESPQQWVMGKSQAEGDGKAGAEGDGNPQAEGDGKAEAEGDRNPQVEGDGKAKAGSDIMMKGLKEGARLVKMKTVVTRVGRTVVSRVETKVARNQRMSLW